ncbi:Gfo/Idh/MocA family protein [Alicyclobacillus sp. SO9]|uniref:Gfo/Idh/MocA family protein n=1 Tax=Alicyclobacillus sp. SO9 TaxID=2665646 RepID=UPI0018E77A06|nr:Gfo/Idh/MocA family oxidoreductase [Alicyclobacillus sp. SO9]QQE80555.1 Gfo/Idh/MocA family oxidoreductase [Alicyclobacillus sp. SO9]
MKPLNVAVIGAGSISDLHLKSYQKNQQAAIVAICDINEGRARAKAAEYGIERVYTDYHKLLEDREVESVSICTWNNLHAQIAMDALRSGKNVLVEKPLSRTLEEALQLQQIVKETGGLLQVGFVRRYASNTEILNRFIQAGELGEIYYSRVSCLRRLGNPGGWFADVERSGGGPLIDLGVHIIDIAWYLMGRPKVKSISGNTYLKLGNRSNIQNLSFYQASDYDTSRNTVEDFANALIRFENGASMTVDVSYTLHAKEDELIVKLYGEKGGAEIEPELAIVSEKYDTILNVTPQVDNRGLDFVEAFQNEINHFVGCSQNHTESRSPVDDGVEIMKMLVGIYESAQKGTEIYFD